MKNDIEFSDIQPLGAVLDTGAQRGPAEILSRTETTLNMQPAVGKAKKMTGILMGAETVDQHDNLHPGCTRCVWHVRLSDSLISAGRLMEAG